MGAGCSEQCVLRQLQVNLMVDSSVEHLLQVGENLPYASMLTFLPIVFLHVHVNRL